ncbi:hypothetical protein MMC30_008639 [Trapelia coarctata]|nr:hypothetical protein [Trapelia coarctata]
MADKHSAVRMLDYGCGPGLASQALFPWVSELRGIDVSDAMVSEYNKAATTNGLSYSRMHAVQGDLMEPVGDALGSHDIFGFDVAVLSIALHHFDKPGVLIKRLMERLTDGAVLVVVDWTPPCHKKSREQASTASSDHQHYHDHSHGTSNNHGHGQGNYPGTHTVAHDGFTKQQMETMSAKAGCNKVDYVLHEHKSKVLAEIGMEKQLFFARGRKNRLHWGLIPCLGPLATADTGTGSTSIQYGQVMDPDAHGLSVRMNSTVAALMPQISSTIADRSSIETPKIDLATAENWLLRPELIALCKSAVAKDLTAERFSYPLGFGGDPALLGALASFFDTYFHPSIPVSSQHVVVTAGASSCLDGLLYSICDPGDSVLVPVPYWNGFDFHFTIRSGISIVPVHTRSSASPLHFSADFNSTFLLALADAYASEPNQRRVKALVLTNPHNPFGQCYSHDLLKKCMQFCCKRGLHFVSDEVYALSEFADKNDGEDARFVSALAVDLVHRETSDGENDHQDKKGDDGRSLNGARKKRMIIDRSRVHVVWSTSKDFGSSGFRIGCLVSQANRPLLTSLALTSTIHVSSLAALVTTALLTSPALPNLIALNKRRLAASYRILTRALQSWRVEYLDARAGLFVFARLGWLTERSEESGQRRKQEKDDEKEEGKGGIEKRLRGAGVLVAPGKSFHLKAKGWVRIGFAVEETILREALRRIEDALGFGAESEERQGEKAKMARKREHCFLGAPELGRPELMCTAIER